MTSRLFSIIRKEFIQIFRDTRTLIMVLIIPIMQLFLLGYSATNDVRNVPLAVGSSGQSKPYFTFTPAQLDDRDGDGWPEFYPQAIAGQPGALPYV